MKSTYNDVFEAYFLGQLSPDDKKQMEQRLTDDSKFAAEFEYFRILMEGLLVTQLEREEEIHHYDEAMEQLIFSYLNDDLGDAEKEKVEKRMQQESKFAALIEQQKNILDALQQQPSAETIASVQAVKPQLSNAGLQSALDISEKESSKIVSILKRKKRRILMAAAALLALVIVGWWYISSNRAIYTDWPVAFLLEENEFLQDLEKAVNAQEGSPLGVAPSTTENNDHWAAAARELLAHDPAAAEPFLRSYLAESPQQGIRKLRLAKALIAQRPIAQEKIEEAIGLLTTAEAQLKAEKKAGITGNQMDPGSCVFKPGGNRRERNKDDRNNKE